MLSLIAPLAMIAAAPQADARAAVDAAMAASAAGWNAGDLDRFMAIYADDATFVAGGKMLKGRAEIAGNYRPSFAAGGNSRGRLSFQPQAFRPLSGVHILYVARWTLTPTDTAKPPQTGLTSLVFERRREGWKIIADHSS